MIASPVIFPLAGEAGDEPVRHWITDIRHDNRHRARRLLSGEGRSRAHGHDEVHLQTDQFRGKVGEPLVLSLGPSGLKSDTLTFHISELTQRLPQDIETMLDPGVRAGTRQ